MSLEKITSRLGKRIIDGAAAIYHSTIFKIGAFAFMTLMAKGCTKPQFFKDYWPPESVQAEVKVNSGGKGVGLEGKFEGSNSSTDIRLGYEKNEFTIEDTGNTVEESRPTADVNMYFKRKKLSINPVVETVRRDVKMPSGECESHLEAKFASVGIRKERGFSSENHVLVRPYVGQDEEEIIITGDTIDIIKYGVYMDAKIGMFLPLFSFEKYDIDFGTSVVNLQETQAGLAVSGKLPGKNLRGLLGAYLVSIDDETDETEKIVSVADLTLSPRGKVFGFNGSYDGDLLSVGAYGCFGGSRNSEPKAKAMSQYIRQMQNLNFLARGLPESVIKKRKSDLIRDLGNLDAKVVYLIGMREEHNTKDSDKDPELYLYIGGIFPTKNDTKIVAGATLGSVFEPYPKDHVDKRYGILFEVITPANKRVGLYFEDIGYENIKPEKTFALRAVFPFR